MIIVDSALAKRQQEGNPIKVAMVGAGFMGRGIALQILTAMPGIRLVAISNRNIAAAERAYREGGATSVRHVDNTNQLERAIAQNQYAITDDFQLLCQASSIEAIIDATGDAEFGAQVTLEAIRNGKHIILNNAELDATVGPILKVYADRAGVVYTNTDGDEPGVAMNLFRFIQSTGYRPVLMGQIKGLLDHYRNPETQQEFAAKYKQKPAMVASFADGSKLALESTLLGNATGFIPSKRGMFGHRCAHVKELLNHFQTSDFANGGLVDFVLGAEPHTGAFVIAHNDHPIKRNYLSYFKMGDGPLYVFYTPYHLAHMQLPHSVARAVLFHDATLTPIGAPVCDTMSVAKKDLKAGEVLDGMGGFTCYGLIDTYNNCNKHNLLPMAISQGCRLKHDIPKDQPIAYNDVTLPEGRLCDKLRNEQNKHFGFDLPAKASVSGGG